MRTGPGAQPRFHDRVDVPRVLRHPVQCQSKHLAVQKTGFGNTIADLERKVGRQAVEIDFFKGVFKRLEELPKTKRHGGEASTRRSGE